MKKFHAKRFRKKIKKLRNNFEAITKNFRENSLRNSMKISRISEQSRSRGKSREHYRFDVVFFPPEI